MTNVRFLTQTKIDNYGKYSSYQDTIKEKIFLFNFQFIMRKSVILKKTDFICSFKLFITIRILKLKLWL
jgi:hypothetical protein